MTDDTIPAQSKGTLIRVKNGDVICYDETGLILRLSDQVIGDIAARLGTVQSDAAEALTDTVDAWNITQAGDWLYFDAHMPGRQGMRRFRKHVDGGGVITDASGPLCAILGLGGARAALGLAQQNAFPQNVLCPADDIGAVGHAGVEEGRAVTHLETSREQTHEALVAQTLLKWRQEAHAPLHLYLTRVETDPSGSIAELGEGAAYGNLMRAAENLIAAAESMGKPARVLAVCLDYAIEDQRSTAPEFRDGMLTLMRRIERDFSKLGLSRPHFVTRFEAGTAEITQTPSMTAQWELDWSHGDHNLITSAPSYMFAADDFGRPTDAARIEMGEMTAAALQGDRDWMCPRLLLAERDGDHIRVTARARGALVLDPDDPLGAGASGGFSLIGAENDASVLGVEIDPLDTQAILIRCDKRPEGSALQLAYACAAQGGRNTGALRDGWSLPSESGTTLHRWAIPALLPVHGGPL